MQKFSDPRIRILHRYTPGPGGYAARNLGIREAQAEWVAFLDADDEWYPEHLARMAEMVKKYPDVNFFSCGWETNENGKKIIDGYSQKYGILGDHEIDCKKYLSLCVEACKPVWTSVVIFNKKTPFASNLFPEEKKAKRGGDLHAWLKLMCSLKTMVWSPHVGSIYHRDSVNMVTRSAPISFCLTSEEVFKELEESLDQTETQLLRKVFNRKIVGIWK